jgi:hypothetical protein
MITLLAVLEVQDFVIIGAIMLVFAGSTALTTRPDMNLQRLELQMRELHKKLDALLKYQGVEMPPPPPSGLSPEVERLASIPSGKIAAIKLYRHENPGVGLREAKIKIEEFYNGRQ